MLTIILHWYLTSFLEQMSICHDMKIKRSAMGVYQLYVFTVCHCLCLTLCIARNLNELYPFILKLTWKWFMKCMKFKLQSIFSSIECAKWMKKGIIVYTWTYLKKHVRKILGKRHNKDSSIKVGINKNRIVIGIDKLYS